ncbi:Replication protein A 70 kDa DNA-binding subunit B [Zea mays]|uniref:Replication protein A subunit n=1 Tax=Zea mays TaxID=4577 RepID=C0HES8_MAIZE|nr:Replication protein A 70 kDa DNA-binding subunit B [Zea mays]ACN25531.1 unknown [Zea mays]ONL95064.1 Replication protein A 70 kDa DNA-binding subunit B [Zea mays]
MDAAKLVTPVAVSHILAHPSAGSDGAVTDLVVQVLDLKSVGTGSRFSFTATDGKDKIKAMLPTNFGSEVRSGNLKNLGLIRIIDYTCNVVKGKDDKVLVVIKCELVCQALDAEINGEAKKEEPPIVLKPKDECVGVTPPLAMKPKQEVKSASQIVNEQRGNTAPVKPLSMTKRVHPLITLNPYQGNWVIKVRVTSKGNLRTYRNARGEGCVFNVELTDEDGTQIQATMFNDAAKKFYPIFELGKVYYVSKGSLRIANKQFKTVQNDYEMSLNENAIVEEAEGETCIPQVQYNLVKIDQLGSYVGGRELVDIVGVVQSVSPTLSVRRKIDNETIPKRDIVVADDSGKTVSISLWNDLATTTGQELLNMADSSPVVAIKSLKVSDFQGVSLSTVGKSTLAINPDLHEAQNLKSWYDSEGKDTSLAPIGAEMGAARAGGFKSTYSDRVFLSHITSDPAMGQEKPVFFSLYATISHIKPDQNMWYRACKTCNKKVTETFGSGYWCEGCQKNDSECSLRYIMVIKVSDPTGEAWFSVFNEHAEKIIGCSADELDRIRKEEGDDSYVLKLKEATWVPHLFRVSVTQHEYNNEKRQRITVRSEAPVEHAAESKYLLEQIAKLTA